MGCIPISDGCCTTHFDCTSFRAINMSNCHHNGKSFNFGDQIPDTDTNNICLSGCSCEGIIGLSIAKCDEIKCVNDYDSKLINCVQEKSVNDCCSSKYICEDIETKKFPKCHFQGREYLIGETIYSENFCHKCICQANFDNSTIIDNPNCKEIECGLTLKSMNKFLAGCIPIYYGSDKCCPIDWRCPVSTDNIIAADVSTTTNTNLTCDFGSLKLKLNDTLKNRDNCVECKCKFPPMAHCIRKSNC